MAILVGGIGLAGWISDSEILTSVVPGWVSMKANTAVLLMACGAALLLGGGEAGGPNGAAKRRLAFFLALLAVVVGALTLAEYLFGGISWLDQLLFSERAAAPFTSSPGRMAPETAISFILTGLALLLADQRARRWAFSVSEKLALCVFFLAFQAGSSHFYRLAYGSLEVRVTAMAPLTAAAFVFLAVGLILARPGGVRLLLSRHGIPRTLLVWLIPAALITPATFGWLRLMGQKTGLFDVAPGVALTATFSSAALTALVLYLVKIITKMSEELRLTQFSVDSALDAILRTGPDGRVLYANAAACALLNYTSEEITGKDFPAISAIYKDVSWASHWEELKKAGHLHYETEFKSKDGGLIPVDISSSYINQDGLEQKSVFIRDLRERKEAETILWDERERISTILDLVGDPIFVKDNDHRITLANQAFYDIFGLDKSSVIGKTLVEAVPEKERQAFLKVDRSVLDTGAIDQREEELTLKGLTRTIITRKTRYIDRSGSRFLVGSIHDITERKRAEQTLLNSEKKFRELFNVLGEAIQLCELVYDEQGRPVDNLILDVNPAYEKHTGLLRGQVVGRRIKEILSTVEQVWLDRYDKVVRTSEMAYFEEYNAALDKWFRVQASHIEGNRFVSAFSDVTERKRAETALRETSRELVERNAELERFLYTASHDLKTPAVTIRTFLAYLEQDLANAKPEQAAKDMLFLRAAADKMARLLDDLLMFSRLGRVVSPNVCVTLQDLAGEALAAAAGKIEERGVRTQVSGEIVTLCGDRLRLADIWQNLVENACKYMGGQKEPRIEIGAEKREAELVYFVRDNGMGIDPRFQTKVFGLFEKLDGKSEGTGIGLALVHRIVGLYGGRIWVESAGEGQGSCFCFTLPAAIEGSKEGEKK